VCQQLYAETNILPLKLNSVYLDSGIFSHLATILSEAQRNVIFTVRIDYIEAKDTGYFYHLEKNVRGHKVPAPPLLHILMQLTDLERVVIDDWGFGVATEKKNRHEEMQNVLNGMKHYVGERKVQIEFEAMN
jgi:hypothetical protein